MPAEKPKPDPFKDPRITAMTAVILTLICPLLLRAVCYLVLTFSAMAIYVGFCGVRASYTKNRSGYLFLSIIGMIGGLVFFAIGLIMGYAELSR
ncbi:MAG: hypothetical protein C5B53_13555 [Candidatus Melainabacteria bacterium]|nr:MAG: hypothetical protein C5B53_13555 [Candidatus Melainabacteria bacterium]